MYSKSIEPIVTKNYTIYVDESDPNYYTVCITDTSDMDLDVPSDCIFSFFAKEIKTFVRDYIIVYPVTGGCHILYLDSDYNRTYGQRMLTENIYTDMTCHGQYIAYQRDGKYGVATINKPNFFKELTEPIYNNIIGISHGCVAFTTEDGKYALHSIFSDETVITNEPIIYYKGDLYRSNDMMSLVSNLLITLNYSELLPNYPFHVLIKMGKTKIYYVPLSLCVYTIDYDCTGKNFAPKIEDQLIDIKLGLKERFTFSC